MIPHETESFSINSGSATGHFWVKVPTVSSASTTDIYVYYGNSEAVDGQDPDNVWDDNYLGVWHYSEDQWNGTSGEIKDSTSNNCNGTRGGSATTTSDGKIDRAGAFNGSGYAALYNVDNIDNAFTLSAWVLNNNDLDEETGAWFGWPILAQGFPYYLGWQGWTDGWTVCFYSNSTKYALDTYDKYLTADTWYYISGTYDSSSIYAYRNGASIGSSSKGDHDVDNVSTIISGEGAWDGLIDEVRISSVSRSADWIKFEYRNMAEADNELTWSSEEEAPQVSPLSNLIGNPYMFTGRRFDRETGLYYYRARYYDPNTGRFLQTDPIGYGDSINWYNYCGNNPSNYSDPLGMRQILKDNIVMPEILIFWYFFGNGEALEFTGAGVNILIKQDPWFKETMRNYLKDDYIMLLQSVLIPWKIDPNNTVLEGEYSSGWIRGGEIKFYPSFTYDDLEHWLLHGVDVHVKGEYKINPEEKSVTITARYLISDYTDLHPYIPFFNSEDKAYWPDTLGWLATFYFNYRTTLGLFFKAQPYRIYLRSLKSDTTFYFAENFDGSLTLIKVTGFLGNWQLGYSE